MIPEYALRQKQSLALPGKVRITEVRIREWYDHYQGQICVNVSGRDSLVLLDIVRSLYPRVPAVFSNTGLEFPEIVDFMKNLPNTFIVKPKMHFTEVLRRYGYPVISKEVSRYIHDIRSDTRRNDLTISLRLGKVRGSSKLKDKWFFLLGSPFPISDKCCYYIKKNPLANFHRENNLFSMVGILAEDSNLRRLSYLKNGCNIFDSKHPVSRPMAFWLHKDVKEYVKQHNLPIPSVYDHYEHTGCMFCCFGMHLEECPNRFQLLKKTHPKQWAYCLDKLGFRQVLDWLHLPYNDCHLFPEIHKNDFEDYVKKANREFRQSAYYKQLMAVTPQSKMTNLLLGLH